MFLTKWLRAISRVLIPEDRDLTNLLRLSAAEWRELLPQAHAISESDAYAIWDYGNKAVRSIVWAIKYRCHREILERAAALMYEEIMEVLPDYMSFHGVERAVLVPIPSSKERRRQKGWNQSEELCLTISRISERSLEVMNLLEKVRETPHQTSLNRTARLKNVEGSMVVSQKLKVENQKMSHTVCVIIDDVYTTGATTREARRALKHAGVGETIIFTLAH